MHSMVCGLDDAAEHILKGLWLLCSREDISSLDRNVGHALHALCLRPLNLALHLVGALARIQIPLYIRLVQPNLSSTLNQGRDLAALVLLKVVLKQLVHHLVLLAVLGRIQDQPVRVQRVDNVAVVAEGDPFLLADLQHPVADQGRALGAEFAGVHGHLGDRGLGRRGVELVGQPVDLEFNVVALGLGGLEGCDCFLRGIKMITSECVRDF